MNSVLYLDREVLNALARRVLNEYDRMLLIGSPVAIPIEKIIQSLGIITEFQYLRKDDRLCGETVFDDAEVGIYDMETKQYVPIIVKANTIIADVRLLEFEGRLRFTFAHELAHWLLHRELFRSMESCAAMLKDEADVVRLSSQEDRMIEKQADMLGVALIMPITQIKKAFYRMRDTYGCNADRITVEMAELFCVSKQAMRIRLAGHNLI
jgi:hypothetical protein